MYVMEHILGRNPISVIIMVRNLVVFMEKLGPHMENSTTLHTLTGTPRDLGLLSLSSLDNFTYEYNFCFYVLALVFM